MAGKIDLTHVLKVIERLGICDADQISKALDCDKKTRVWSHIQRLLDWGFVKECRPRDRLKKTLSTYAITPDGILRIHSPPGPRKRRAPTPRRDRRDTKNIHIEAMKSISSIEGAWFSVAGVVKKEK